MKWIAICLMSLVGGLLVARSPLGLWIGNEARALSDRVVLATLQLTSEFESEL